MWLQNGMIYRGHRVVCTVDSNSTCVPEDAPGWNLIDAVVKRSPKKNPPAIKHSWLEMPFFCQKKYGGFQK